MSQASNAEQFIQLSYAVWGQVPNSNALTYWKVTADGSVLFESRAQLRTTGDEVVKTWRLDPTSGRFAEIEHILAPAKTFMGRECQTYPTVSIYWTVQWEPENAELKLHAACLDAWAEEAYQVIGVANRKIEQWMEQAHPDFDKGAIRWGSNKRTSSPQDAITKPTPQSAPR